MISPEIAPVARERVQPVPSAAAFRPARPETLPPLVPGVPAGRCRTRRMAPRVAP